MEKSKPGLLDLGETWYDWVLDLKSLSDNMPDDKNGLNLSLYGVDTGDGSISVGCWVKGENYNVLGTALCEFISVNTQLLPLFFTVWTTAADCLEETEQKSFIETAMKVLQTKLDKLDESK